MDFKFVHMVNIISNFKREKRKILHFVDSASCNDSWWMTNVMHKFFYVFISIYNSLHVSSTQCSSSGETNFLVFFQPAHISTTNIEWRLPEAVLKQFVSPDDEHCVLETCRQL